MRTKRKEDLLLAALANLLGNAFKFSGRKTEIKLSAFAKGPRIFIEVEDRCGGLAATYQENMFTPFVQGHSDKTGLGLGLSIARQSIESVDGTLTVRNMPGSTYAQANSSRQDGGALKPSPSLEHRPGATR